jgi:threonine dehydratase
VIDVEVPGVRTPVVLKLEFMQHTASFKPRGAFANLLDAEIPEAGVAAASGGNHGAAVAYAARALGIPARIFVPAISSPAKIARIRGYGADVVVEGENYAAALVQCEAYIAETGALSVHAYDAVPTICGQGTVGLELEDEVHDLDTVLAAVGGGGFIGGIAAWFQGGHRVVGVEPETCSALHAALAAGEPVTVKSHGIASDSLGASRVGELMFSVARRAIERVVLVSDADIVAAQAWLWRELRVVTEPGGAAAFAALLSGAYKPEAGERVAAVLCGANTDLDTFAKAVASVPAP